MRVASSLAAAVLARIFALLVTPVWAASPKETGRANVEINKLFRLVRGDVMEAPAGRQEPHTYGSLPGKEDFFLRAEVSGDRDTGECGYNSRETPVLKARQLPD